MTQGTVASRLYGHFSLVDPADWRWPSFSPREIACKGTGQLIVNFDALDKLQALRDRLGKPLIIHSAYRSPAHNAAVGGARRSKHMQGIAFDVRMENHDPIAFEASARAVGFTAFGYYPRSGFMHIDTGPARTWGTPWPESPTRWPVETVRAPETIGQDREAQAVAGASVAGAVAVAAEHLPAATSLLGALAPTAQLIAVAAAALFLAFVLYKRMRR